MWLVKSDERLPIMYGSILAVLMSYRAVVWMRKRPRTQPARRVPQESSTSVR
jgi:hypothetical protein